MIRTLIKKLLFHLILLPFLFFGIYSCFHSPKSKQTEVTNVAEFKGQQVTGVSVSDKGRIFVNFPRWRNTVENSVVEISKEGNLQPYPNKNWNSWNIEQAVSDSVFIGVQSVVAFAKKLYVLDTRNPIWEGTVDAPRVYVFNLKNNSLEDILILSEGSYKPNSYINDLRVDLKNNAIYFTDSNEGALVIYDLSTRKSRRVLDNHFSTRAETDYLTFDGKKWGGKPVHSDGIALNPKSNRLFFHSLTGYTLYSVSTAVLLNGTEAEIEANVKIEAETGAPDGMIFDKHQNLYLADLEHNRIDYLTPEGKLKT